MYTEVPPGALIPYTAPNLPPGYLWPKGGILSRTTYSRLFNALNPDLGSVSITVAAPAVATLTTHGMVTGDAVYLTTTGTLPTGLSPNTLYWVTMIDVDSFKFATSWDNAIAGTNITTTGTAGSGHSLHRSPWGIGDGSTTFNLPDLREGALVQPGTRGSGVTAHDVYTLGYFKDDAFQGFGIDFYVGNTTSTFDHLETQDQIALTSNSGGRKLKSATTGSQTIFQLKSDGTNGSPRPATVTRGKRIGINYIIKY